MTRIMVNRLLMFLVYSSLTISVDAYSQQWTKISAETHYGLRVQIGTDKEWCVEEIKLEIGGEEIFVPPEAHVGVCNVYLNGAWVSPEISVTESESFASWTLSIPIVPAPGKNGALDMDPDKMTTYEFNFDRRCLKMRRVFRGGGSGKRGFDQNSTMTWECGLER